MENIAAVLHGARDLRIQPWPEPKSRPGWVVVQVEAVGVCGSDVHYYRDGRIHDWLLNEPMVLGHEPSGRIIDPGTSGLSAGTLVAIEPGIPCGHCQPCWTGAYNLCANMAFMATPPFHGAMARRIALPADWVFPVGTGVTAEQAAMTEPLAVGLWAAVKTKLGVGDQVLVIGAGPIGVLAAQTAHALGAARVVLADINADRVAFATKFDGISPVNVTSELDFTPYGNFDVVLECSGASGAFDAAVKVLNPRARLAIIGIGKEMDRRLDLFALQAREASITGVYRYAGIYPKAVELISNGLVDVAGIITHRFRLTEADQAMTIGENDPTAVKAVVLCQE
ncbi:MAG: alcohol dehydrogenase catalytic domain-containing protein [Propionibacteriaceae bacterium]|nr:alcohol dehydrogenase catalytic domain-containing protein [Propionibacteriaceae bacterium]